MIKVHPFILHGHRLLTLGDGLMSEENFYFVCRHVNPCFTVLTLSDCPTVEASGKGKAKLGWPAARDQIRIAHEKNFGEVFMGPSQAGWDGGSCLLHYTGQGMIRWRYLTLFRLPFGFGTSFSNRCSTFPFPCLKSRLFFKRRDQIPFNWYLNSCFSRSSAPSLPSLPP